VYLPNIFYADLAPNALTIEHNMKKSLYAQYVEEREGAQFIERAHGFAVFKMASDHCYLQDIFVEQEFRQTGLGVELMNEVIEVAKSQGHIKLIGSVVPSTPFSDNMFKIMQGLGFKLLSSSQDIIFLVKEI
jgi:GNAT superfamily N-acetyltransferase